MYKLVVPYLGAAEAPPERASRSSTGEPLGAGV